ncbi:MAG: aminotransferase class V-fold PLP-dependent enzyme [Myxococcota bacterium]
MRVYLNHAGTSWPKPEPVRRAVGAVLEASTADWPERFATDHAAVAEWLGAAPSRLLLTPGCTAALAAAIAELPWSTGDRVICGSFEHKALARPLAELAHRGVHVVSIPSTSAAGFDLAALERELKRGARLVATAWATNVTGELSPIAEIIKLAHAHGAKILVDAAQAAGWLPIDVAALGADMLAFAGHKGPQAPWGVGGLYVAPSLPMPGYCDTGSVDRAALAGLVAGVAWLRDRPARLANARAGVARLRAVLPTTIRVLGPADEEHRVPTLAFVHPTRAPVEIANALRDQGVVAGAGRFCAADAHVQLGTTAHGVVRLSVGPGTTTEELAHAERALHDVIRGA